MHGEYKVHGGKLVVADLDVVGEVIRNVQVAGDFFLEPPEALDDICAAIEGLPANASEGNIVAAIESGVRSGAALIGFNAQAIAIAVLRALGVASVWRDYPWQIVHEPAVSPAMHLALDDVMAREVAAGRRPPTLRIWEWDTTAIILGCFQSLRNEVDMDEVARQKIDVVRRTTGGGAMLVEPGSTVTYSLYAPADLVRDMDFAQSYAFLDDWVLKALNAMGIEATYKPLNDITSPLGKIGGAAQKRFAGGVVLHHVTMAYDMDADKMVKVLRIGREKLSDKGTKSANKRVDPLRSQTGLPRDEIVRRLKETFVSLNGGVEGQITPEEYAAAQTLASEKFSTEAWLRHIP